MITNSAPLIAITMGDAAGVGPEIIVKALQLEYIHEICKPLVIGESSIMQKVINLIEDGKIGIISTTREDYTLMRRLPNFMGTGERDSFAICKNNEYVLVTDDKKVIKLARKMNVEVISLHMILRALWALNVCSKDEVKELIESILEKDRKILDIELIIDGSF